MNSQELIDRLNCIFHTDDLKLKMIETSLGTAVLICHWLQENIELKHIPDEIKYCMMINVRNMMTCLKDDSSSEIRLVDKSSNPTEQNKEKVYRSLREIVFQMHKDLCEEEQEMKKIFEEIK